MLITDSTDPCFSDLLFGRNLATTFVASHPISGTPGSGAGAIVGAIAVIFKCKGRAATDALCGSKSDRFSLLSPRR